METPNLGRTSRITGAVQVSGEFDCSLSVLGKVANDLASKVFIDLSMARDRLGLPRLWVVVDVMLRTVPHRSAAIRIPLPPTS